MKISELKELHKKTGTYKCHHCEKIYDLNPDWDAEAEAK